MTKPTTKNPSEVWCLESHHAVLCTAQLTADVDLLQPRAGLHHLKIGNSAVDGSVLGIFPGSYPLPQEGDLTDKFVRGNDLIVTYAETGERPFSLQVYWRATTSQPGILVVDAILSLQTALLESFPGIAIETKLPVGEHLQLPLDGGEAHLIRSDSCTWSYAETTHPDDAGESEVVRSEAGELRMVRQLGGRFLEKGVIRRLRVRGVFLPRENDESVAAQSLKGLACEQPPLTV